MFPDDGREYFIVTFETISAYKAIELQTRYRNAKNMLEKSAVMADMAKYTWSLRYNNARNYYIIGAGGDQSAGEAFDASMGYLIGSQVGYAAGQAIKGASNQLNKIKGTSSTVKYGPMDKGPLADEIANTFRSGTYTKITTQEEITLYRVYGGKLEN